MIFRFLDGRPDAPGESGKRLVEAALQNVVVARQDVQRGLEAAEDGQPLGGDGLIRDVVGEHIARVNDAGDLVGQPVDLVHQLAGPLQVVAVAEVRVGDLDEIKTHRSGGRSARRGATGRRRQKGEQAKRRPDAGVSKCG